LYPCYIFISFFPPNYRQFAANQLLIVTDYSQLWQITVVLQRFTGCHLSPKLFTELDVHCWAGADRPGPPTDMLPDSFGVSHRNIGLDAHHLSEAKTNPEMVSLWRAYFVT
jgi:hypothetical protein